MASRAAAASLAAAFGGAPGIRTTPSPLSSCNSSPLKRSQSVSERGSKSPVASPMKRVRSATAALTLTEDDDVGTKPLPRLMPGQNTRRISASESLASAFGPPEQAQTATKQPRRLQHTSRHENRNSSVSPSPSDSSSLAAAFGVPVSVKRKASVTNGGQNTARLRPQVAANMKRSRSSTPVMSGIEPRSEGLQRSSSTDSLSGMCFLFQALLCCWG